jgi:hypothetical protein
MLPGEVYIDIRKRQGITLCPEAFEGIIDCRTLYIKQYKIVL